MNGYEIVNFIGEGQYSSIFKVRNLKDHKEFILKKLKFNAENEEQVKKIYDKFNKISNINHPNIIKYHEIVYDQKGKAFTLTKHLNNLFFIIFYENSSILLEYADKGDLQTKLNEFLHLKKTIDEEQIWIIFFQLLKALKSLHGNKIVHKALKPSNILLTSGGVLKLGDIDIIENRDYPNSGIPINYTSLIIRFEKGFINSYFNSPELWDSPTYTEKCDIWTLGCVMYEVCSLKPAFRGENVQELVKKIIRGYYPPLSKKISNDLILLIASLLTTDPKKRPNTKQLLELEFVVRNFNNLIEKNALNKGLILPEIKHIYANNPFGDGKASSIPEKKPKKVKQIMQSPKSVSPEVSNTLKKNQSIVYENKNLNLSKAITSNKLKTPYFNQTVMKMKSSLEKIKRRKIQDHEKNIVNPYSLNQESNQEIFKFKFENLQKNTNSLKILTKEIPKKTKKEHHNNKFNEKMNKSSNESHLIDLNYEIKLPEIEKSKILTSKEQTFDSFATDRVNNLSDKRFITRNLSFNQVMMNKIKNETRKFRESRIISLKEIHQKYVLI